MDQLTIVCILGVANMILSVALLAGFSYLYVFQGKQRDELMRQRARLNTVTDKGNPIRMKKSPLVKLEEKVEFDLDVLDLGDY